jgi:hypothetical protein
MRRPGALESGMLKRFQRSALLEQAANAGERACLVGHQPGLGELAVTLGADGTLCIDSSSDCPEFCKIHELTRIAGNPLPGFSAAVAICESPNTNCPRSTTK